VPTLLVLGSKPDPLIPALDRFDAVACANASGFSAKRLGLPVPMFTVMSSIVTSGKNASNRLAIEALRGLSTGRLYVFPRRPYQRKPWKQLLHPAKMLQTTAPLVRRRLAGVGYGYEEFVTRPVRYYLDTVARLVGNDPAIVRLMADKVPSVGMLAVALGLAEYAFQRIILSGFSFEITHAYARNPLIEERGSTTSRHADTDIAALDEINRRHHCLLTTEPIVHARTGIPLLTADGHEGLPGSAAPNADAALMQRL
jgi:hypothetical protein